MNVEYIEGRRESCRNLTKEQAAELSAARILDPNVDSVKVFKDPSTDMDLSRHERRRWRHGAKVYNRAAVRTKRKKRK